MSSFAFVELILKAVDKVKCVSLALLLLDYSGGSVVHFLSAGVAKL